METINLPPNAYSLMNATRYVGYSFEDAIADLIDNSISAQARHVDIYFNSAKGLHLSIIDDGEGMTYEELCQAMRYGSSNPNEMRKVGDLGRYGLGLKTASLSQCKRMTVASIKNGQFSACQWDLNALSQQESGAWTLNILTLNECKTLPSMTEFLTKVRGTIVIWQEIDCGGALTDVGHLDEKLDSTRETLALLFHRYLQGEDGLNKLEIRFNNALLLPKDPFLQYSNTTKRAIKKGPQILEGGISIVGYILPHEKEIAPSIRPRLGVTSKTLRRTQGFYIYRNKRLITYGKWFSLQAQGEFFKFARVQVDIPNTVDFEWSLDVKKSTVIPPRRLLQTLQRFVERQIHDSEETHITHVRGRPRQSKVMLPWTTCFKRDEVSSILINRDYPIIKAMLEKEPQLTSLFTLLEKTLPLDAIQLAKRNEATFENEQPIELETLKQTLRTFILMLPTDSRSSAFDQLLEVEPYRIHRSNLCQCKEEICAE